jgi:uncharacterized protein (TIGR03083 family)
MFRHGFDYNRWVAADGRARGQQDPGVALKVLRNAAGKPRGARPVNSLMHVLIHGQDICRPLGIRRDLPEAHLIPVADFVTTSFIFRAKKRIEGFKLTATDMDWSYGRGPEVMGPAEALVMMMAGRLVALDDLSGEGKAALAAKALAPR